MKLDEIKKGVEDGLTIHWANDGYKVIKDKIGQFLIVNIWNDFAWGLTWRDGITMNESEDKFYIGGQQ
jgi:hypothetical protein